MKIRFITLAFLLFATPAFAAPKVPTPEQYQAIIQTLESQRNAFLDQATNLEASLRSAQQELQALKSEKAEKKTKK